MKKVKKIDPEIKLHVVGEGKIRKKLIEWSSKEKLNIEFYGNLQDNQLNDLYKSVSVQIIPSIFEGFGLTVLEGMAKGIPIIATDVDGIREVIETNENGILINYGNSYMLAKKIVDLINNDELQKKLTQNAYRSLNRYNWVNIYKQHINLYESIYKETVY